MRCNEKQLMALAQLRGDMNFQTFMEWIMKWLEEEVTECVTAERPAVNQGRAQVLTAIAKAVDESRENLVSRVSKREVRRSNDQTAF